MSHANGTNGNGKHPPATSPELAEAIRQAERLTPADRGRLRAWLVQAGHVVPMDGTEPGAKAVNSVKG